MSGIFPTANSRGFYTSNSSFLQFVRKQWKYNEIVEIMRYLISIIEFIIIFKYLRNYYSFCANWWNYDVFLKIYSIYLISTYSKLSFVSKFLVENIFQFSDSAVARLRERSATFVTGREVTREIIIGGQVTVRFLRIGAIFLTKNRPFCRY